VSVMQQRRLEQHSARPVVFAQAYITPDKTLLSDNDAEMHMMRVLNLLLSQSAT